ncbi:MAG TPA: hypothetical protein VGR10_07735, partial [Thermoleophilaceae bacterium]|nr:hypothetical protein [Thermoleophilaceae bacterium]
MWRRWDNAEERTADEAGPGEVEEGRDRDTLDPAGPHAERNVSRVAERVHELLEAAEAAAARIRERAITDAKEAAADAGRGIPGAWRGGFQGTVSAQPSTSGTRADDPSRARRAAEEELGHLWRLADALSVQADAVKRQCAGVLDLLQEQLDDSEAVVARRTPGEPAPGSEPEDRESRGATPPAGSVQWVEAYRMRLAGADRGEVAR